MSINWVWKFLGMESDKPNVSVQAISPGKYILHDASPWPPKDRIVAEVFESKEGWVRYNILPVNEFYASALCVDCRMPINMFSKIYKKENE